MNWKSISEIEKQQHPLYHKTAVIVWVMHVLLGLSFLGVLIMVTFARGLGNRVLQFELIMPSVIYSSLLALCWYQFRRNKKLKTAEKWIWIFIASTPFADVVYLFVFKIFILNEEKSFFVILYNSISDAISQNLLIVGVLAALFAAYSRFSQVYRLQYLGLVKSSG